MPSAKFSFQTFQLSSAAVCLPADDPGNSVKLTLDTLNPSATFPAPRNALKTADNRDSCPGHRPLSLANELGRSELGQIGRPGWLFY